MAGIKLDRFETSLVIYTMGESCLTDAWRAQQKHSGLLSELYPFLEFLFNEWMQAYGILTHSY